MRCYIFDIDGTLSDLSHRLHYIQESPEDWDRFHDACVDDAPVPHMILLAQHLAAAGVRIIYVSARTDRIRGLTQSWLGKYSLPPGVLYMRKNGDRRPDDFVKAGLLSQIRRHGFEPIMAFEDRTRVVQAYRAAGLPCAQVAAGDF